MALAPLRGGVAEYRLACVPNQANVGIMGYARKGRGHSPPPAALAPPGTAPKERRVGRARWSYFAAPISWRYLGSRSMSRNHQPDSLRRLCAR